jgi:hypothetical protein
MNPISSSKPYKCDICSILAVNYDELLKHQIAVHIDKMFQCQSCNKVFDTTIKFEIHAAEIHGNSRYSPNLEEINKAADFWRSEIRANIFLPTI